MRRREEVSLWLSVTHHSYLQCFSGIDRTDPTPGLHDMHFRGIQVLGNRIYHHDSSIRYENSYPSSRRRHRSWSSYRPSSLLGHHLSCGTVQHERDPNSETIQDYSTRCDILFPGYIQFTSRACDVSMVCKCKNIVTMFYHFSTARLDLIVQNQITPCQVSDTRMRFLRLFIAVFSVQ